MAERVVRQAEQVFGIHGSKALQNVQVDVSEVLSAPGVVRVALQEPYLRVQFQESVNSQPDLSNIRRAASQEHWLPFPCDVPEHLRPSDVARADLVNGDIGVQHVYRF